MNRISATGLLAVLFAGGCTPTCEQSCHKLLSCDLTDSPRTAQQECQDACTAEESLYASWKDNDPDNKLDRLKEQRRCIGSSTCDEIDAGVCFDDALEAF